MRVLVTSPAALGHIHPMVPLARALLRRGHDVLWAVPADGVAAVARTGIEVVATGPPGLVDPRETMRRTIRKRVAPDARRARRDSSG